jgi:hypothetical protein
MIAWKSAYRSKRANRLNHALRLLREVLLARDVLDGAGSFAK